MKTTIEMHGYEITISEPEEGMLLVQALKDGEVIEEFELEGGEDHPGHEGEEAKGEEDIKSFDDFGGEEEDFGDEESQESQEDEEEELQDEEEDEEDMNDSALESFQSFINKKK